MPFMLARGQPNVTTEVQRWQFFLHRRGIGEVGALDGQFGQATERATTVFQRMHLLQESGKLDAATLSTAQQAGYTVVADDHYDKLAATKEFPQRPKKLSSPSHDLRNEKLGCYVFLQPPFDQRGDKDGILVFGTCDKASDDWERENIVRVPIPELAGHPAAPKSTPRFHRLAATSVQKLFSEWAKRDLLHLIISWEGSYVARYKRTEQGSDPQGHDRKLSKDVPGLSNHAFGTAFDINATWNGFGEKPAPLKSKGCVMELVEIANKHGFFWGGHFNTTKDGMHFELAVFQ